MKLLVALCIAILVAVIIVIAPLAAVALRIVIAGHDGALQKERQLLYQTNGPAVFEACTQVWSNRGLYRTDPEWHNVAPADPSIPDPTDPRIPTPIRALRPSSIFIGSSSVRLEMGGGPYHYGLEAFMNGTLGTGTKQLSPGLWYYAEDGAVPPP
jgi:hypothetical protein